MIKLFISCVTQEFDAWRAELRDKLDMVGMYGRVQCTFSPTGTTTLPMLDNEIQDCDAVVHIVGAKTGATATKATVEDIASRYAPSSQRFNWIWDEMDASSKHYSYTQWEAYLAILHKKPTLVAPIKIVPPTKPTQEIKTVCSQLEHIEQITRLGIYPREPKPITTVSELIFYILTFSDTVRASKLLDRPFRMPDTRQPSVLVDPRSRVVAFKDFHGLHDELFAWARDNSRRSKACLLTGRGGIGKTRLAAEITNQLLEDCDWFGGLLRRITSDSYVEGIVDLIRERRSQKPLIIVVDNAEAYVEIVAKLTDAMLDSEYYTRLIMITRSEGQWWFRALVDHRSLALVSSDDSKSRWVFRALEVENPIDRIIHFHSAAWHFFAQQGAFNQMVALAPPSDTLIDHIANQPIFGRPLYLQMAGLIYASGQKITPGKLNQTILDDALTLEYNTWSELAGARYDYSMRELVHRGVCQITLVQGTDSLIAARDLLAADPAYLIDFRSTDTGSVQSQLERILPSSGSGIASLSPDLLGEHHIATLLGSGRDDLVMACFKWAMSQPSEKRSSIIRMLNGATQDEHGPAGTQLSDILERIVGDLSNPQPGYGYIDNDQLAADLVFAAISSQGSLAQILQSEFNLPANAFAALHRVRTEVKSDKAQAEAHTKEVALLIAGICTRKGLGKDIELPEARTAIAFGRMAAFLLRQNHYAAGELCSDVGLGMAEDLARKGHKRALMDVGHDLVQVLLDLQNVTTAEQIHQRISMLLSALAEEASQPTQQDQTASSAPTVEDVALRMRAMSDLALIRRYQEDFVGAVEATAAARDELKQIVDVASDDYAELDLASKVDLSIALIQAHRVDEAVLVAESIQAEISRFDDALDRSSALSAASAAHSAVGNHAAAAKIAERAVQEAESANQLEARIDDFAITAEILARQQLIVDYLNLGRPETDIQQQNDAIKNRQEERQRFAQADQMEQEVNDTERYDVLQAPQNSVTSARKLKESGTAPRASGRYREEVVRNYSQPMNAINATMKIPAALMGKVTKYEVRLISSRSNLPRWSLGYNLDLENKINIHLNSEDKKRKFPPGKYVFACYLSHLV